MDADDVVIGMGERMSDTPMPPADPTPPLTAADTKRLQWFLDINEQDATHACSLCTSDADTHEEHCVIPVIQHLLAAHAALTATATDTSAVIAALTVQLSHRTAERDAARERHRAVENILRNVEEHHVQQNQWKGCDETRSHTLKWIREARATLAAPTEG